MSLDLGRTEAPVADGSPGPLADLLAEAGRDLLRARDDRQAADALARHAHRAAGGEIFVQVRDAEARRPAEARAGEGALLIPIPGGHGALRWRPHDPRTAGEARPRLDALAALAATALTAAAELRGVHDARAAAARHDRLLAVSGALGRAATAEEVVRVVVEMGVSTLGAHAGSIARLDPDGKVRVLGATGYPSELMEMFREVPLEAATPLTDAVRLREAIFLEGAEARLARYPHLSRARRVNGDGAMAAIPFGPDAAPAGAIGLNFRERRAFTEDERSFILALARLAGGALERARLYEAERAARAEAERATRRLSLLLDASTALSSTHEYAETLDTLARLAVELLADACTLYVREGRHLVPAATRARDPDLERRLHELQRERPYDLRRPGAVASVYHTGRPVVVPRVTPEMIRAEAGDAARAEAVLAVGMRSAVMLPLRMGEETGGVLVLTLVGEGEPFGDDDVALGEEIARRAGVALDKARLLQAARDAETRLENIIRSVPGVVWEAWGEPDEREQRIGYVSPHVEKMLGYTEAEWLSRPNFWLDIVHPDDREEAGRRAAEHFARGGEGVNEFRWVRKDGGVLDVLTHAVVVHDEHGRPVGMRGVTLDVTAGKRAEEQVRLHRRIFESSNDGIAIVDAQGRYLEQNEAHRRLIGYDDAELAGVTPALHMGESTFAEIADELARTGRVRREVVSRTRDGRTLDLDLSAFTMRDAAGNVVCHVGIKRDITARRRTEEALRARVCELEAIYRLSDNLGRAERVDAVYAAAMDCLAATLAAPRCSILLHDESRTMRFVAWRNLSETYRAAVEGHSPWSPDEADPRVVLVGDTRADPSLAPLLPVLDAEGVRSLAFVPLMHQGRLVGKFMVYYDEPRVFTDDELRLAGTIASHLAFGIARVRAEEAVRTSEARFRTLIEQSPLSMQTYALDGEARDANEAWERLWKSKREDLRGYNILRDPQLEAKGLLPQVRRAFEGDIVELQPVLYDPRDVGKSGEGRWVRALFFPLRGADGKPREIVLVLEDVTEGKRAGDILRENERRLAAIFAGMAEGIALFDAEGRARRLNPAALRILGREEDALLGRAGDDAEAWGFEGGETPAARVLRTGEPVRDEERRVRTGDGRDVVLSVNAVPLRDLEGRMTGIAASFSDVTHRTQAEDALRRSEAWLRTIFDSLDAGVLVVEYPQRLVGNLNHAITRLFGYERHEVLGRSTRMLHVDDAHFAEYGKRIAAAFARGEPARFEFPVRRKDGSIFPSEQTVSLLRTADGAVMGGLCVIRDLTEEKAALAELEAARRQVANTEKLSALGSLVSGVAHEIRTPLAYITNHLFLIQQRLDRAAKGKADPATLHQEVAVHAASVMEGVDRINRIVGELRRFTRLKAGERTEAPLHEVVEEAVDLFRATHRGRIEVVADLRPTPKLPLDPLQVQQVVLNLLDNAADAMNRTGVIRISVQPREGGADLAVADSGTGIPPEVQARMFDPLFTTKKEGTGLGLSIVRRIIEAHGGTLRYDTTPGEGTTFHVHFPGPA